MLLSARLKNAGTMLFENVTQTPGTTVAIPFDLSLMPTSVTDRVLLTVSFPDVHGSATHLTSIVKSKVFLRVPAPPASYAGSVWQLDHEHRGVIKNGWQQFIGLGWFNTPFNENYYQGGACSRINFRGIEDLDDHFRLLPHTAVSA